jgi:AcrR family transcriptional regulator
MTDASPFGFQRLSLAALAERLGVRTPSLFKHVAGLPALRRELALLGLRLLGERLTEAVAGRAGDDAIRALAEAYRAFARDHPGLYAATQPAPAADDAELASAAEKVVGVLLRILEAYQLRGDDALHAVRAWRSALHGFVALETAGGFGLPLDLDESYRRLIEMYITGLRTAAASTLE